MLIVLIQTSHLISMYTVWHFVLFLTEIPVCISGCVQIQRRKSSLQKPRVKEMTGEVKCHFRHSEMYTTSTLNFERLLVLFSISK